MNYRWNSHNTFHNWLWWMCCQVLPVGEDLGETDRVIMAPHCNHLFSIVSMIFLIFYQRPIQQDISNITTVTGWLRKILIRDNRHPIPGLDGWVMGTPLCHMNVTGGATQKYTCGLRFITRGLYGHRVLSLPASVCPSVCQSLACPRDNSRPVQARITKFEP